MVTRGCVTRGDKGVDWLRSCCVVPIHPINLQLCVCRKHDIVHNTNFIKCHLAMAVRLTKSEDEVEDLKTKNTGDLFDYNKCYVVHN